MPSDAFKCEKCRVHGGQRSQRIQFENPGRAGICQVVGANPKWDYQISVWYTQDERVPAIARLGIDPNGGTDPASPNIVWTAGSNLQRWSQLTERVTAAAEAITIFLEAEGGAKVGVDTCFDDVKLIPIQPFCPEGKMDRPEEPAERLRCVDFTDLKAPSTVPAYYEKEGFTFISGSKQEQNMVGWGVPADLSKLLVDRSGILALLPFAASVVRVKVAQYTKEPVAVAAYNSDDQVVGQAIAPNAQDILHTLEITGADIVRLKIVGGGGEGLLFEVCIGKRGEKEQRVQRARKLAGKVDSDGQPCPKSGRKGRCINHTKGNNA